MAFSENNLVLLRHLCEDWIVICSNFYIVMINMMARLLYPGLTNETESVRKYKPDLLYNKQLSINLQYLLFPCCLFSCFQDLSSISRNIAHGRMSDLFQYSLRGQNNIRTAIFSCCRLLFFHRFPRSLHSLTLGTGCSSFSYWIKPAAGRKIKDNAPSGNKSSH